MLQTFTIFLQMHTIVHVNEVNVHKYSCTIVDAGPSWGSPLAVAIPTRGIRRSTNMEKRDYYEVLGIPRNATQKDIKKAYYKVCDDSVIFAVIHFNTNWEDRLTNIRLFRDI